MVNKKKLFERPCPSCGWTTSNSTDHPSFHATQAEAQNKQARDLFNKQVDASAEALRKSGSSNTLESLEHIRGFISWMSSKGLHHTPDFAAAKRVLSERQFKDNMELTAKVYDRKNKMNRIAKSKKGLPPA